MHRILRHPIVRKSLLLAALACAGLLVGEIFQRYSAPTAAETLTALGASRTMMQTLSVNDVTVAAEVWVLPDFASSAPLTKSRGKTLTVGNTVFLFEDDSILPQKGICTYPTDLPMFGLECDYVIDTGRILLVDGTFGGTPADADHSFVSAAEVTGWVPVAPGTWKRGKSILVFQTRNSDTPAAGTRIVLVVHKQVES